MARNTHINSAEGGRNCRTRSQKDTLKTPRPFTRSAKSQNLRAFPVLSAASSVEDEEEEQQAFTSSSSVEVIRRAGVIPLGSVERRRESNSKEARGFLARNLDPVVVLRRVSAWTSVLITLSYYRFEAHIFRNGCPDYLGQCTTTPVILMSQLVCSTMKGFLCQVAVGRSRKSLKLRVASMDPTLAATEFPEMVIQELVAGVVGVLLFPYTLCPTYQLWHLLFKTSSSSSSSEKANGCLTTAIILTFIMLVFASVHVSKRGTFAIDFLKLFSTISLSLWTGNYRLN